VRIGTGFDVHRFGEATAGAELMLGGVAIPFERPLLAHSDGDVVIHALCDALLGALALGDIGKHFPDTDPRYHNISSRKLLEQVSSLLRKAGFQVGNVDLTVIAQAPRLSSHINQMCEYLAEDLQIDPGQVSVKATTTEGLGFTGRGEGIACQAVALLVADD